jgi:hypothetical protein
VFPIGIDINFWQNLHYNNIFILALELLLAGGWLFIFWQFWEPLKEAWMNWRQELFAAQNPQVLIEISVPAKSKRNIEAIEQVFAQIHGLRRTPNWWEIWWKGQFRLKISLEIVSFEGQIKFFIRSTYKHKHLVESALQAQYPDVELKPLKDEDDFVHLFPDKMPNAEFDMLGSEYVLFKPQYYPIKTYKEHQNANTGKHINPLRHLLEIMDNLKEGEYVWYQLVLVPEYEEWSLDKRKEVDKLLGKEVGQKPENKTVLALFGSHLFSMVRYILLAPISLLRELGHQLFAGTGKVLWSQVKDDTYQEPGRQLKGLGKEFKDQIVCLHQALASQFRKKKPDSKKTEEPPPSITVQNQISFDPNININIPSTQFPSDYLFRSDKQKKVIDGIERKLSSHIYKTCVRVMYFAKKPVFSKFRFWSELHGVFKHFSDLDYNVFTRGEYTKTTADYFFAKIRKRIRQNAIIANAKSRDWYAGDQWNYLSTEELATLWHLPHRNDLLANIKTAREPIKPPPATVRTKEGYKKEALLDLDDSAVPDNLPVREYEPYTYP